MAERADAICAVEQVISCEAFQACERSLPGAVNMPALVKVDHSAGALVSRGSAQEDRSSPITGIDDLDDGYAIYGMDNGNPWNFRLNTTTGRFTFTSPRDGVGFIGFGVCASRILD
jgi:hypothetical protein